MEENWMIIYSSDEEYQAVLIKNLLENHGLHPILMDRKDDEFRIGQAEVLVSSEEADKAREIIEQNKGS